MKYATTNTLLKSNYLVKINLHISNRNIFQDDEIGVNHNVYSIITDNFTSLTCTVNDSSH